jgi:two-component system nitrogen regulation sensor histidine kinase GlnL
VIAPAAPAPPPAGQAAGRAALDLLATMVAIVTPEGECEFANSSFENVLGLSRRSMSKTPFFDWFVEPQPLRETVAAVSNNTFSTSRLEAVLKRPPSSAGVSLQGRLFLMLHFASPIEGSEVAAK